MILLSRLTKKIALKMLKKVVEILDDRIEDDKKHYKYINR